MKLKKFAFSSLMLAFSTFANAQLFEATGVGETAEKARQNAVTNAIKLSVGEFVVNKEELKNDQFNQTVVSHSNAYVDKVEQLSQKQLAENEFEVKVAVDIKSQKLIDTLKEMQVDVLENATDNNELLSELTKLKTNQKATQDWEQLVDELLIKPIKENKEIVSVRIAGKLKPMSSDPDKDTVKLGLPLTIEVMEGYAQGIKRILTQVKTEKALQDANIVALNQNDNLIFDEIEEINLSRSGEIKNKYVMTRKNYRILSNKLIETRLFSEYGGLANGIRIELVDSSGDTFKELFYAARDQFVPNSVTRGTDREPSDSYIFYLNKESLDLGKKLNLDCLLPSYVQIDGYGKKYVGCFSSGKANATAVFSLTSEEISRLKDVKVSFSIELK